MEEESLPYQQAFPDGSTPAYRSQQSMQPYSSLKANPEDEAIFFSKMCFQAGICFLVNLILTASLATYEFWPNATKSVPGGVNEFLQCESWKYETETTPGLTSYVIKDKKIGNEGKLACSSLTSEAISESVLQDCDEYSSDELRVHLEPKFCKDIFTSGSGRSQGQIQFLKDWRVMLNRSSVSLGNGGQLTVKYSGIYSVYSSLAFRCNNKQALETNATSYWQEIWINDQPWFKDSQRIIPVDNKPTPAICYRSYLHGLMRLKSNDSLRVTAGPRVLLHCNRDMNYLGLFRA